jgi:hypothetical protein
MVGTRQGFKDVSRNIATALMVTGLVVGHSEVETPAGMKFSIYGLPVIPEFLGPIHRT